MKTDDVVAVPLSGSKGATALFVIQALRPHPIDDNTTVLAALVGLDNDLQVFVGFAIDGVPMTSHECTDYAMRLASTIKTGTRKPLRSGGWRRLDTPYGPGRLTIRIPDGWILSTDVGVDFDVWKLHWPTTLDRRRMMGIYSGSAPDFEAKGKPVAIGKLFGQHVQWYDTVDGISRRSEALIQRGHRVLHVWIVADSASDLSTLREAALTLKDVDGD
jgi:hypothetical protein